MTYTPYREALLRAIELSKKCPPSTGAFSVGSILFDATGNEITTGYSRETSPHVHAEEAALAKARASGQNPAGGTIIASLEPCGKRLSGRKSCADRIIAAKIKRVVYASAEPPTFVERTGEQKLAAAGIEVIVLAELAPLVREINHTLIPEKQ